MEINKIEKPWGHEELLEINNNYVVKRLFMKKGEQCSLQYHESEHMHWLLSLRSGAGRRRNWHTAEIP